MARYVVGKVSELPPGSRKIVDAGGRSIGVFNVHGTFYAIRNLCPHQFAPLCRGIITGTTLPSQPGQYIWARDGEIIRCPWHGWEFDITTGRSVFNPHKMRVKTYEVTVEREAAPSEDEDESVETYPVTVEDGTVILHA
ncbi:Rieske (2Fe-2S) protein [Litorilinea aerophila]|uniref:Rieske (2Fe-2S) protein n=1 Tax=Litorilinea aerophila TaxID=1204385 RepID=A0A540VI13_9CHLR|nr:Rieske (2Fe-2S) protein [Litorilinea aerophila]MCC9075966.1 Rieske (2Fe-2S) protein [Litorilinea aerophila]OUC08739.1 hypothetical protein RY27_07140 [Litorilinea aerophila]GIV78676.1 MAG: (2Fe-2S) ferredoxin [Litorilinea sp.]